MGILAIFDDHLYAANDIQRVLGEGFVVVVPVGQMLLAPRPPRPRMQTSRRVASRVGDNDERSAGSARVGSEALALLPTGGEAGAISFVRFAPRPPYDSRLIFMEERGSDSAAAFRLLRQRLVERGDPRRILCTSADRCEGRSTLAANLAMAYAELGKHRVLLIEASFREATLGEMFGFMPPKGFASQLAGHRLRPQDPWVVVQIGGAPLYVMAAEPRACASCMRTLAENAKFCPMCGTPAAPVGIPSGLDGVSFAATIQSFRQSFDYMIFDAPPVLGSGDVNLIQDAADAIVFATRKGRTEAQAASSCDRAGRAGSSGSGCLDRRLRADFTDRPISVGETRSFFGGRDGVCRCSRGFGQDR